ncbi:MAG: hypothetical protein AB1458_11135 [Bacteroidota bacterium]
MKVSVTPALLLLFFLVVSNVSSACLSAYQFKIFPVGVSDGKLITLDVKIRRTQAIGNDCPGLETKGQWQEKWLLFAYISVYTKEQKLLSSSVRDSAVSACTGYLDSLKKIYSRCYGLILKEHPALDLFTPGYISFCDYQKKCDLVALSHDTLSDMDYLFYQSKFYPLSVIKDTSYYGFNKNYYYTGTSVGMYVSSVRLYTSKTMTLVIAHLGTGHEIGLREEDGQLPAAKEYQPKLEFKDIKLAVYTEPIMHHGYGFDIFIVK